MLVKKFEAPTIREALLLVKNQLGPDAIILSARENNSSFGLAGKVSVEITAAVSENQLKKKQFAEGRLSVADRDRLKQSSAKTQRAFIQKSVDRFQSDGSPEPAAPVAAKGPARYIDIIDDESMQSARRQQTPKRNPNSAYARVNGQANMPKATFEEPRVAAQKRVKEATKSALAAAATFNERKPGIAKARPAAAPPSHSEAEVLNLRAEVTQLRSLLESLKQGPAGMISLHPGAESGLPFEASSLYERLTDSGVSDPNAAELCRRAMAELPADQIRKKGLVDAWAAKEIMNSIGLTHDALKSGLHLFVGPSGQGKTSSLIKLASRLVIQEHRSVAIVTTDFRRVGVAEQLRIYSQILNVPFATVRNPSDWAGVLATLRGVDCILVDCPGLPLKQISEIDAFQACLPPADFKRFVHLVLSVNQRDADTFEIARRYRLAHFDDVIFTKLDEAATHGLIYNFQKEFKVPLHSLGIGPMIPEDFEVATRERIVDLIFKLSKLKGQS